MSDYLLNDPNIFLHYQIQVFSAHARILALGYKNAYSVLHVHGLVIIKTMHIRREMSKFATQRQESLMILVHVSVNRSFYGITVTCRGFPHASLFVSKLTLLSKMYRDS